jgi:hypothetical protein
MVTAVVLCLVVSATSQDARLITIARRTKKPKTTAPAVSRAQMELAQQMVRNSYALSRGLEIRQRVALLTRLLYTMRPEIMATEKKEWAEELFGLAQHLPRNESVEVDSTRNSAIATAAARVAVYDPERALDLLDSLPSQPSSQADARTMAARLVFAGYIQHHGVQGVQTLLQHGRKWSEHGGFPYGASTVAMARLRTNEDGAEDFFRQVLTIFERGQEGIYGVSEFASLLEQSVAMEAISEESAEEAGRSIVAQLQKLTATPDVTSTAEPESTPRRGLTEEQKALVLEALNDVRISAPKSYENAQKLEPGLFSLRPVRMANQIEIPKVDLGLQSAFRDLADAMKTRHTPDELHEVIAHGLQLINAKYKAGACAECKSPDAQSWALVSLAAYATPMTIATQLNGIEDPFWHAYFLAIAGQQVGQPTHVADPTARKVPEKEEAEPE